MKKEAVLISVIMNCYNGERYLKEAIDSIYSQTYKNWEIIFWDNASTDKSAEIAESYDSRLKYYRANKTTRLGEARVLATAKATGDYLAFLDTDDLWEEQKLTKQIEKFNNETAFVYTGTEIIYEGDKKGDIYKKGEYLLEGDIFSELAKENFITFSSVIVDRSKFIECGGFPEHFKNSTDYWVFLRLSQKYTVAAVQEVCCKYRVHNNNLSSIQEVIGAKESIEIVSTFLPDRDAVEGLKYQYVQLATAYIKEKKIYSALRILIINGGWTLLLKRIYDKSVRSVLRK